MAPTFLARGVTLDRERRYFRLTILLAVAAAHALLCAALLWREQNRGRLGQQGRSYIVVELACCFVAAAILFWEPVPYVFFLG